MKEEKTKRMKEITFIIVAIFITTLLYFIVPPTPTLDWLAEKFERESVLLID